LIRIERRAVLVAEARHRLARTELQLLKTRTAVLEAMLVAMVHTARQSGAVVDSAVDQIIRNTRAALADDPDAQAVIDRLAEQATSGGDWPPADPNAGPPRYPRMAERRRKKASDSS
jgi:hypothetical protein